MGFIADAISSVVDAVVDVVETVVDLVVDVVESVVDVVAGLLGFEDQTVTLFEVHNFPLFPDNNDQNPLLAIVMESVLQNVGISENLLYYATHRNLKTDLKKYVQYIDDGNYIEDFPIVESLIFYVNQDEVYDTIAGIEGAPVTIQSAKLYGLSIYDWVRYWMYTNKSMSLSTFEWEETISGTTETLVADVGNAVYNESTDEYTVTSTYLSNVDITPSPDSPAASTWTPGTGETEVFFSSISLDKTVVTNGGTLELTLTSATDIVANSGNFTVTGGTVNNVTGSGTSTLVVTVDVTAVPTESVTIAWVDITETTTTNAYADWESDTVYVQTFQQQSTNYDVTVPSKPSGLHFIIQYYLDSAPADLKLFVYKVGTGTYPDLDNPNTSLDIDADAIKAIPPIPLRVNNTNYTTRPQAEVTAIEELTRLVGLEAADVLDGVMTDPSVVGNENKVDHVYLNFGIRLADTSQPAVKYMYNVCQNLYPSQAVTKATYDATLAADDKPQNNVIIEANEYKYLFQWSYIEYFDYTVAEIDADPNSVINGLYYSDLSKFDSNGDLAFVYFVSSRSGTYNVQYIADTPAEVDQFIAGSLAAESTYSSDGAGLLQVTSKFAWTSGTIYESDGTTVYHDNLLRPTLAYEKSGSNLKLVNSIPESVTQGQEISYYRCAKDGMTGYTIKAPIGAFRVVDAATTEFRMVKFNLANENDLMFPLLYDKIAGLSQSEVTQLFTTSAHVSMYVAHVEVIEVSFFSKLLAVVIFVFVIYTAFTYMKAFTAAIEAGTSNVVLGELIGSLVGNFAKQMVLRLVVQEIAGDNPILAAVLMMGGQFVDFGFGETMSFSNMQFSDYAKLFAVGADMMSAVVLIDVQKGYESLALEQEEAEQRRKELTDQLTNARELLGPAYSNPAYVNYGLNLIETAWQAELTPNFPDQYLSMNTDMRYDLPSLQYESGYIYDQMFNFDRQLYTV